MGLCHAEQMIKESAHLFPAGFHDNDWNYAIKSYEETSKQIYNSLDISEHTVSRRYCVLGSAALITSTPFP